MAFLQPFSLSVTASMDTAHGLISGYSTASEYGFK